MISAILLLSVMTPATGIQAQTFGVPPPVFVFGTPEQVATQGELNRMGLAISRDGGLTFDWCGEILRPRLRYATWFRHWRPERFREGFVYPNIGLANYILKDGFFYLYYTDTEEHPDELRHGMAVARARVDEVVKAALEGKAAPWHKYHQGQWREPGLGGEFTPLNLDPVGFLHGDAAYNEALDGYLLVTRKYFYTDRNDRVIDHAYKQAETGAILLSFSRDGLSWSDWQVVHEDGHCHDYPSIVSEGPDNEITGERFWVLFKKFNSKLPVRGWESQSWYRVQVRVNKGAKQ